MVTSVALQAINAQNTGEVFLTLLTLSHPLLTSSLRFVNNITDIVSNGHTYTAWAFELPFPELGGDTLPSLTLTIDNVDPSIAEGIRSIVTPIDVQMAWIIASDPDTIQYGPLYLRMKGVEVTLTQISGSLAFEDLLNEPFPFETYTPGSYPGLF